MTPLPSVRSEHALAIRRINAAYNRLRADAQASIRIGHDGLEEEINAALLSGDRQRAEQALRAWTQHWLAEFSRAAR